MKNCGDMLEVPMHVFGPEIHMTAIVGMALGKTPVPSASDSENSLKDNFLLGKHDIHRRTPQPPEPCEKRARSEQDWRLGAGRFGGTVWFSCYRQAESEESASKLLPLPYHCCSLKKFLK